jgi:hypothetical protein
MPQRFTDYKNFEKHLGVSKLFLTFAALNSMKNVSRTERLMGLLGK